MMLTDLADVLRAAGLPVVEQGGWKTRSNDGNRFAGVQGILCHWTATAPSAGGDYPSLNIVTNGRSDLPGMLAQLGLGRSGTWYVIGAGVAWHAGAVDQVYSDNYHSIGIEAEYHPDQGAWPEVQQRSYERGCAALARHYGVPNDRIRGHYEAAVPYGRKPDPNTLPGGMPGFRQRVAAVNLEEDDVTPDELMRHEVDLVQPDGSTVKRQVGDILRYSELGELITRGVADDARKAAVRVEAKLDALANTLSDDEANIIAAVRSQQAVIDMTDEQVQTLLSGLTAQTKAALKAALREGTDE